jgi:hypothetical protein
MRMNHLGDLTEAICPNEFLSQQRRGTKNTWLPSQFFERKWWSEEESQASERKMISQVTVVSYRYQSIAPSVCFIFFFEFHSFQSIIHHFSFHLTKHTIINFVSIKGSQRKPHKQHFSFSFSSITTLPLASPKIHNSSVHFNFL